MHKDDILRLHDIGKEYVQGDRVLNILNIINASFKVGTSYAITGVSGSGKSTLLHILGGLDYPTQGYVSYNYKNISHFRAYERNEFLNRRIGFVFQFHYLVKELSVRENIMLMGMIKGDNKAYCNRRTDQLLELVGLREKENVYPTLLSGGQQQRVALARALFNKPSFLLADEPTGNLDVENVQRILELLFSAQQEWGMGMIICTHDPTVYQRLDVVYKMHDGNLLKS